MRVKSVLDLTGNELQNAKIQSLGTSPSGLAAGDAGRVWFDSTTGRVRHWDGTAAQNLTTLIESIVGGGAVGVSMSGKQATVSVADATGAVSGLLSAALYNLLGSATNSNTASSLVQRDGSGNFSAGTITAALNGLASNSTALGGQTLAQVRDFSQTTGTRTALSAISDFNTAVRANSLDQLAAPAANVAMNSKQLTGLADPTTPQAAATKNYVDNVATGLDAKGSVRLGTVAALPANTYANGASGVGATLTASANGALSVDGTAVAVNDRILVKNEATAANDGIYVVTQTGGGAAPYILTRAGDADSAAEVTGGMFTFVEGGSTLAASGWVLSAVGAITIGTTAQNFAQFSGSGSYQAGNGMNLAGSIFSVVGTANRISVSGSGVDIASNYVGQASITTLGTIATGVWNGTAVALGYGGTGATTAAGARTNLAAAGKNSVNIPAGTTYSFAHNLNTTDVIPAVIDLSTGDVVLADCRVVDANTVSVTFASAVTANAYRLVVIG